MFLLNAYKAYLIDLDGTLLDLSFEEFTRSYYQLLIERFKTSLNLHCSNMPSTKA